MRVVFFGSSSYVLPIIEVLKSNFELSLVVTTEKNLSGAVPSFCKSKKIPFISVTNFDKNLKSKILTPIKSGLNLKPEVAVLADFGLIVPGEILNIFPKGILNIHPSLLPKYRGPSPVQTSILNGDEKTGVSIIRLDEEVDHGPVLAQKEEKISPDDTADSLYRKLFKIGADLLPQTIQQYIEGSLTLCPQDDIKASFTEPLTRKDGFIDITNPPQSAMLDRMIRAFYPWPGVWGRWHITEEKTKILKLLPNQKIQVEGKKPVSYKDFLNGYPEAKELIKKLSSA